MGTTSAVIITAELLMFLSSGSGHPNPSLAPSYRPPHLLLHTGPLVRAPQCYSSTVSGRLPMVKKTSCDYWVIGVPGGVYWCVDSTGVHSIKYYWRKKIRPLTQQLAGSDTDLLNLSLIDPPDQSEGLEEGVSNGQKLIFGEVTTDGDRVTHCSALNLTGNTMLLKEQEQEQEEEEEEEGGGEKEKENIRCPAQKEKDEHGVERNWPAIILGSTYKYRNKNKCVEAARTCMWSKEQGLHLTPPERFPPCPVKNVNLTWAVENIRNISRNNNISTADIEAAAEVVDQALQVNDSILSTERQKVSSLLRGLDALLTRVRLSRGRSVQNVGVKVAIFVLNVEEKSNLTVALESDGSSEDLENSVLHTINSVEEIKSLKVDVAVQLPQSLMTSTSHVALAIFSDESAFHDPRYRANSRILSLNMVQASELQGEHYVDIVFRPRTEKDGKTCAFWDFTLNEGAWSTEGCQLLKTSSAVNTHDVCRCSHLTHFAELITQPGSILDPVHRDALTIISIIGCSLSFVGLLAIFATGAAFRQWRAQIGNKILLHLSTAVSINMLVFLITSIELLHTGVPCIILGVMLHYSVLASFCWMLVSALLQLKRLVIIFGFQHIPHLLLKASLFAWGAPLLPIAILLAVDVNNYTSEGRRFCYPKGLGFYLAVLCPVLMIVTANLLVFGMILHSIFRGSPIKSHKQTGRKLVMQRIATSGLLFFLLGLSWVFGLVAHLSTVFAYLFCIIATLQGFVLFVFFVLGKKQSRFYWVKRSTERNVTSSTTSTPAERALWRSRDETTIL